MTTIPQPLIKLYLNGDYKIEENGELVAVGISQDTGLRQLDAFLGGLMAALSLSPEKDSLMTVLAQSIRQASERVKENKRLLVLDISSTLDPKEKTMAYTFTLQHEDPEQESR